MYSTQKLQLLSVMFHDNEKVLLKSYILRYEFTLNIYIYRERERETDRQTDGEGESFNE